MKPHMSTVVVVRNFLPCISGSGLLFSEELKTIIFGLKNSLFLSELYYDTSVFNLEQF